MRRGNWDVSTYHWADDAILLNRQILDDLERGATSFTVMYQAGVYPGIKVSDTPIALDGVYLNMCRVTIVSGQNYYDTAIGYSDYLKSKKSAPDSIQGSFGMDPVGTAAVTGSLLVSMSDAVTAAAELAVTLRADWPKMAAMQVDTTMYHSAGGTEAQELAAMLSTGVAYLRALESAGMSLEDAASSLHFTLAADAEQYLTTAKFRAARRLWAQVLDACGVSGVQMYLNAHSSMRMLTVKDPWVNILRATTACLGAAVGGANNITILPHDTMIGLPSDFARRIARNVQIILQEESGLSKVADPAAGSYALETLTSELTDTAWGLFQDMEAMGGITAVLTSGELQASIDAVWQERMKNISKRRDAVTGVSEFPDICEKALEDLLPQPKSFVDGVKGIEVCTALPFHRTAESFEMLRAKSDDMLQQSGSRPKVLIATIGTPADYTARATFAKNLFEAGGIEAVYAENDGTADTMKDAMQQSGADFAVLCGSDDGYAEHGAAYASRLAGDSCKKLYLAGRPPNRDMLKAAGVDSEIFMGCDVLGILLDAYTVLGEAS